VSVCPACRAVSNPTASVCRHCGSSLEVSSPLNVQSEESSEEINTVVFSVAQIQAAACPNCNAASQAGWVVCPQCGGRLVRPDLKLPFNDKPSVERQSVERLSQAVGLRTARKNVEAPAARIKCPNCSQLIKKGRAYCHHCGSAMPQDLTVAIEPVKPEPKAQLQLIADGERAVREFDLKLDTTVGRVKGDITFPGDDFMSSCHARIVRRGNKFVLVDENSRNGTFIRISGNVELKPGDMILIGKQLFRFVVRDDQAETPSQ